MPREDLRGAQGLPTDYAGFCKKCGHNFLWPFFQGNSAAIPALRLWFAKGMGVYMKHTVSIKENRIFSRLYRQGKSQVTPYFVVYVKKNRQGINRMGITATKKIGNAVERNRAKRVIKEAYRILEPGLPTGIDIVIVARRKAVFTKMQVVMSVLRGLKLI